MPQSVSAAKHRFGLLVQLGLTHTAAPRGWVIAWVRLRRPPGPDEPPATEDGRPGG